MGEDSARMIIIMVAPMPTVLQIALELGGMRIVVVSPTLMEGINSAVVHQQQMCLGFTGLLAHGIHRTSPKFK